MNPKITRRALISSAAAVSAALAAPRLTFAQTPPDEAFSFVLLGDLHFDHLAHHDRDWIAREKPNDWRQIENYSRITSEVHPLLMDEVRAQIAERAQTQAPVKFVLQVGDVVEGLCGTPALAQTQDGEAMNWVKEANLGAPLLFCKGNHDITGPGAVEAYREVFLPFLGAQSRQISATNATPQNAFFAIEHGGALFAFFDAYDDASLVWLETTFAQSRARHKFALVHPPVVPYGARATWHVYSKPKEAAQRARLLSILSRHHALVLGGHIHKYNLLARRTDEGQFAQLAVCSVIPKPDERPGNILEGVEKYTPDQIAVEPNFSPATEAERRAVLAAEAPFVTHFEYADAPDYAIITVDKARVTAQIYSALGRVLWKTRDLTALARGEQTL